MFDIAFSEILVIAVVALIVIGPEKLPKTARTMGHLYGRLRRYVSDVKADISREMDLEELRKLQQQVHTAAQDIETSMASAMSNIESSARTVESELNSAAALADAPAAPVELPSFGEPPATPAGPDAAPEPARQATLPGLERP
jgi:sec-independent protein translocase protein TatB